MAICNCFLVFVLLGFVPLSTQEAKEAQLRKETTSGLSLSFPLAAVRRSPPAKAPKSSSIFVSQSVAATDAKSSPSNFRSRLQYNSMALIVSLPIGTPPQPQDMVLDTGSELSWIQCSNSKKNQVKKKNGSRKTVEVSKTMPFDPSMSTSFSLIPCKHPLCTNKQNSNYALPTSCDSTGQNCDFSLFYADGSFAEGNLVREKFNSRLPVTLGCTNKSASGNDGKGILGMNLGRLSFAAQSKISTFSYCMPQLKTQAGGGSAGTGSFYLGHNPYSTGFQYVDLLTLGQPQQMPNCDPLAYTVPLERIQIGGRILNVSTSAFRPDASGSGQTIMDSGTEFTYLVEEAYAAVRAEIVRAAGAPLMDGYAYQGALDMCFEAGHETKKIGRLIGDVAFVFRGGVKMVVEKERNLVRADGGAHCMAIGRSDSLGIPSNIIGNFFQRGYWVEFNPINRKLGLAKTADCSR